MTRHIPIKSLTPDQLAIAAKAFDAAMDRAGGDSPSIKQDVAADVLAQIAAGETNAEIITNRALTSLEEVPVRSYGAKLDLPKKDVL